MTNLAVQKVRAALLNAAGKLVDGGQRDIAQFVSEPYLLPALTLLKREIEEELALVTMATNILEDSASAHPSSKAVAREHAAESARSAGVSATQPD